MLKKKIEGLRKEIREEFGYSRGVKPIITDVIEHSDSSIHVILSDRAEKSLMIGPGGRIASEIRKRMERSVSFYGADELLLQRYRLDLASKRIGEVFETSSPAQRVFLEFLREQILTRNTYPEKELTNPSGNTQGVKIHVAFSGGVDSGASLYLTSSSFQDVIAITANPGPRFIDPREMLRIQKFCSTLGVKHHVIPIEDKMKLVIEQSDAGAIHPCKDCHSITMSSITEYSRKNDADILLTGELLPSGRQSIVFNSNLLVIHLPAALALTKYYTRKFYERVGIQVSSGRFGCHFLAKQHRQGWKRCGPSLFRVLRELQAGILSTGEARKLIRNIFTPALKMQAE